MSEAARHQAMPQNGLFVPPTTPRAPRPFNNQQNRSKPSTNNGTNRGAQHRTGGRGR